MDSHLPIAGVRTRDQQEATAKCPLFVFIDELRRLPDAAFGDMERMLMFLTDHPVDSETLENCLTWDRQHYIRNLIDRTSMYELIAICWEIGQISAIHDHDDQHCWM